MGVYMDANSYSQYWQNETIKLIDNQRWIAGRAFGMLKPIALIVDIAKNIFLSLKNIFSLSNSCKHSKD